MAALTPEAYIKRYSSPGGAQVTLRSRFPEIISIMNVKVAARTKEGAERLRAEARRRAPVSDPSTGHSGRLRDSIVVEDRRGRQEGFSFNSPVPAYEAAWAVVVTAKGDDGTPYGHLVEFGSVHNEPQPYLIPAYEAIKDEVSGLVTDELANL